MWPLSVDGLLLLATVGLLKPSGLRTRRARGAVWLAFLLLPCFCRSSFWCTGRSVGRTLSLTAATRRRATGSRGTTLCRHGRGS
ncbi:hypothetical protein [Streptomyces sp. NPDC088794]|uniref:hypothetical protein n=1 Tax=Streptomyces sp. NPDC088794 TaxID=3365902 RepID=UPI0037F622DA